MSLPDSFNSLHGKTALITGSARGIGFIIASFLGSAGARVVISDILEDQAANAAEKLKKDNIDSISAAGDISKADDVEKIFKAASDAFGGVDILVNNAGITKDNLLIRMDEQAWDAVMAVNLKGAFLCTKAAARDMMKKRYGRIINISSIVGIIGNAGQTNYSASKAGLIALTKSTAKELAGRGITANAIAPGFIATEMTEKLPQEAKDNFINSTPLRRPGTPQDVASAVLFLVSDAASYITGQVIPVDGGMVM